MIELLNISKHFGPLVALDDVSLQIHPGQILGLLGENGAGKSTLMNILAGLLRPTTGTIRIAGRETRLTSSRAAQRVRIGMVHQHFKLIPTLTVLENFALFLRLPPRTLRETVPAWLERLHWALPLDTHIEQLAIGQQQRVEILRALMSIEHPASSSSLTEGSALSRRHAYLILDEPTAVLTPPESAELFTALRGLRDAGTGIIFISHKLAEIRRLCDSIAILRRGRLVHSGVAGELIQESLAEKMIGAKIELPRLNLRREIQQPKLENSVALLSLEGLSTAILKNVSLALHPGEILGLAGVDGNGQSELAQIILGIGTVTTGQIQIVGTDAAQFSLRQRLDRIAFIAEDRQREGLVLALSIEQNLLLKEYRKARFNTAGWLRFGKWRRHADALIRQFDIRANSAAATVGSLSGGNQQKVVLARELHAPTASDAGVSVAPHAAKSIVLAMNPTRGLDVGATAFVMQKMLEVRDRGGAVLLIHSDLDELLAISDRVTVLYNGTLTDSGWPDTSKEAIGRLMLGIAAPSPTAGGMHDIA